MDSKPKIQLLKQKRSFLQYILLSVVTCSLYHYWFMDSLVKDVNAICKKDGQDTVGVGRMIGFSILTFGVYQYLWLAEIVDRVYDSADEYDVEIRQDSESFFIWMILVPFIGYFIAYTFDLKKVTTTMSRILCIIRDIITHSADKSSRASGTRWVRPPSAQDDKHNRCTPSVYPQSPYRKPYKSGIRYWREYTGASAAPHAGR